MSLVDSFVEVTFERDEDFLKIKETLTRMGVASRKDKTLFQSCHILHKAGRYYIVHFKQLFALDGKPTNFSEEDKARLNRIVSLLEEWDLVSVLKPELIKSPLAPLSQVKIIHHKEKSEWVLESKYSIGKNRR